MLDLRVEVLDALLALLIAIATDLQHFEGLVKIILEERNRLRVLLRQLQRGLHLHRIVHDVPIQVLDLLEKLLLVVVGVAQGTAQLLVLDLELLQRLVLRKLLQDLKSING